jgi:hypothetical protein
MWGLVGLLAGAAAACADGLSADGPPDDDDDTTGSGLGTGGNTLQAGAGGDTSVTTGPSNTSSTTSATNTTATTTSGSGGNAQLADLIDDLESGTGSIIATNGRVGAWYTYNDESPQGTQTPLMGMTFAPAGPGYMSALGAQTVGSGFAVWGAGMGFDLNNNGVTRLPYNVSAYSGIVFWAKGNATVRVKLPTTTITPVAESGTCTAQCSDAHGMAIALTGSWTQYSIAFSQLAQEGWGLAASFEGDKVLAIQFQVAANVGFDFWIDDIGFY